eukprot:365608-Chlamydomonas_euryale.AAC.14
MPVHSRDGVIALGADEFAVEFSKPEEFSVDDTGPPPDPETAPLSSVEVAAMMATMSGAAQRQSQLMVRLFPCPLS